MKSQTKALIILSVFAVPLSTIIPVPGTIVWYPQLLTFLIVGFLLLSLKLIEFHKALGLFSIYLLFSYVFICHQHPKAMLSLMCGYLGCFVTYFVAKANINKSICISIAVVSCLQLALLLFQWVGKDPFFHPINGVSYNGMVGLAGSHNQLGIYSAGALFLTAPFTWLLFVASMIPLLVSKTSSALIGFAAGASCYFLFMYLKNDLIVFIVILALFSVIWLKYDNFTQAFNERISIWKLSVSQLVKGKAVMKVRENINKIATCNPLTGYGLSSFMLVSPSTQHKVLPKGVGHLYEHAHNDLVEAFFEFGYIGFSLLCFLIMTVVRDFLKVLSKTKHLVSCFSSLVALSVCSLGVYVFHAPLSYFMFMLILGLFYSEVKRCELARQESLVSY